MALTKTQAIYILASHNKNSSFMANVIQHNSQYNGVAAKYLKALAVLVGNGMEVSFAPPNISDPYINGRKFSWESVLLVSGSVSANKITAYQARTAVNNVSS